MKVNKHKKWLIRKLKYSYILFVILNKNFETFCERYALVLFNTNKNKLQLTKIM